MRTPDLIFAIGMLCLAQCPSAHETELWRASDSVLVEICFDNLDESAPSRLRAQSVTADSMGSASLDLVGLTLTKRPIYRGINEHPKRFRSLLVALPGTEIWVKIDAPPDMKRHVDTWRDVPISYCTADQQANFKLLYGKFIEKIECPPGINVSLKVTSGSEHALELLRLKAHGLSIFNGLRGCRDLVYAPSK